MYRRSPWAFFVALCIIAATACGGSSAPKQTGPQLFANPNNPLTSVVTSWSHAGRHADAKALQTVAATPAGVWAAGQSGDIREIAAYSAQATRAHKVGLVVAYNLPYRDSCGKYSSNDKTKGRAYRTWIDHLATAVGSSNDIVVVEPDAVSDIVSNCLNKAQVSSRYELLQYAMQTLGKLPHAQVYLDAGNPGMSTPSKAASFVQVLAAALVRAGVYYGKGFSANVSNFQQTDVTVAWAQWLEKSLGHSMRAVIDTSRNGNGPYVSTTKLSGPDWCNPPGRSLGARPTLTTGQAGIAGYLWVKDPGVSDGACNGGPEAGQLWPQYAVGLAQGNSP